MKRRYAKWAGLSLLLGVCLLALASLLPTHPSISLRAEAEASMRKHAQELRKNGYYILVDFDKPVFRRRLWVIDRNSGQIVFSSHVSHGWRSGLVLGPRRFSNTVGSFMSMKGAFVTGEDYTGKFGHAMKIDGLELGMNDRARGRAVVFHRHLVPILSRGCFMTFPWVNERILGLTKGGSFLYVHGTGPIVS